MDLTEKTTASEQILDGVLLRAYRDTVELPDGGTSVREWIHHPGAAAVVPLFPNGSTLLVRQFRYPPRREFLEVPAGKLDEDGEDPEDVARRELEEEVGHTAARLTRVGETYPCIGYSDEVIHLFLAEDLSAVERASEDDEFLVPVRMPLAEAVAMARRGEVLDAKSTVALLVVQAFLETRDR
ncbi:MAG: NUDIX hydrolase [Rubricoccaceae bacterium]|nr:NUDIX hydrolase [Rubricoccaceae bacterium]